MKIVQTLKNRWKVSLGIAVIAAIALGVSGFYYSQNSAANAEVEAPVQTATVRQGDIIVSASGGGTVIPATEVELSFSSSGVLAAMPVRVGQEVAQGDILAQLGNLAQLESSVASAELDLLKAQQTLDSLYADSDVATAQAQLALANAQIALENAIGSNLGQQPEYRQDAGADIASLEAQLILAEEQVEKAEDAYNDVVHLPDDNIRKANALINLETAKENRDSIVRQLNWYYGGPTDSDQALLDAEVAAAEATYEEALRDWEAVKDGVDQEQIALAESELANAQAQLTVAQENLAGAAIVAPFDATVLAIYTEAGEMVGSGAIVSIADLNQPLVEIYLDETDFNLIDLDYEVEVVFDAYPDDIFIGYVIQVDPQLGYIDGVPVVRGVVKLDNSFMESGLPLLMGSNASVEVIAGRGEGVLLVPVEALREITSDQYAVFVMVNGEPELRMIEVGLIDITFAEILSGLQPGDLVTTGIVETE